MKNYIETSMVRYPSKFIDLLKTVNDETLTMREHQTASDILWGFKLGWEEAGHGPPKRRLLLYGNPARR